MRKNIYLELIRGVASIMVLLSHLISLHPIFNGNGLNIRANWGLESVIVFFILSGIVINISQTKRPTSKKDFFVNRLVRLYPQFLVGCLAGFILYLALNKYLPPVQEIFGNLLMLSTLQGYITQSISTNNPIWSLTFEMFFYIMITFAIGKNKVLFLKCWLAVSLIALPLYYLNISVPVLNHFIAMFAFSVIWLIGYFLYQYRKYFQVDIVVALFSLGMLPLAARLNISNQYYCPLKFIIFSIVAIPFFRYWLDGNNSGIKINKIYVGIIYTILASLIWFNSNSLIKYKIVFIIFPLFITGLYFVIKSLKALDFFKKILEGSANITGKYSYSMYIIHYPVLLFFANLFDHNIVLYILASGVVIVSFCWVLESVMQPGIVGFMRRNM